MEIAISSASLYPKVLTEVAVVNIAAMGCRTVEIFLQTRSEYKPEYVKKLARLCNSLGLTVHSLHAAAAQYEPMLFYQYSRQNRDGWEILRELHQAGAMLGASCHVFHGPLRSEILELPRLVTGIGRVAAAAANWGLKLALENVSWCTCGAPDIFKELNRAAIDNLFYTFDSKQAERSGYPFWDFIDAMGPKLINVHLSEGNGDLPSEETDFSQLKTALKKANYRGPAVLEVYGWKVEKTKELRRSWLALKKIFG